MTFFKSFRKGLKSFGENISLVVNTLLLTVVYIIGVGLTSIIAKIVGKHFIEKPKESSTYWKELNIGKKPIKDYYRQF